MSEMRLRDDASVKKFHKVSDGTTYRAIPLFPSAHRSNVFYAQKCRKAGLRKTSPFADSFELVFVHNHPYRWSNLYSVETDERYTCLNLKPDASSSLWVAKPKPLTTAPRRQKRVWNCSLPVNALRSRRCDTTPPFDKTSRARCARGERLGRLPLTLRRLEVGGGVGLHIAQSDKVITSTLCGSGTRGAVEDGFAGFSDFLFNGHFHSPLSGGAVPRWPILNRAIGPTC